MSVKIQCEKYDLLCFRYRHPKKIHFRYNPANKISLDPAGITEKKEIIKEQVRLGKKVEIRPLYRYLSHTEDRDNIILDLGHTDFGEYLLTDITHPEWNRSTHSATMSHPLSISAATFSKDHLLLIGYRSQKVISESGMIQTIPGGFIHPPDSILKTAEKELDEELAVKKYEIADISVTGFATFYPSGKPEILLAIRLNIPSSAIFGRHGIDGWEFSGFRTIPESQGSITDFLKENGNALGPASHAALVSFAILEYGIRSVASTVPIG